MFSTTSIFSKIIAICALLISLNSFGQLDNYRNLYFGAQNAEGKKIFYNTMQAANESNAVFKAYKGVSTAMYAEVASSVEDKFKYFDQGKVLIEAAIQGDFWNPEIRFLRYSVQAEVPWFLKYNSNLQEDANIVLDALKKKTIDPKTDFWKKAITFIIDSDELPTSIEDELKKFKL